MSSLRGPITFAREDSALPPHHRIDLARVGWWALILCAFAVGFASLAGAYTRQHAAGPIPNCEAPRPWERLEVIVEWQRGRLVTRCFTRYNWEGM